MTISFTSALPFFFISVFCNFTSVLTTHFNQPIGKLIRILNLSVEPIKVLPLWLNHAQIRWWNKVFTTSAYQHPQHLVKAKQA